MWSFFVGCGGFPLPLPFQFAAASSRVPNHRSVYARKIAEAADKASVVTISHYHFDHHTPSYEDWVVNWTEDSRNGTPNLSRQNSFDEEPERKN